MLIVVNSYDDAANKEMAEYIERMLSLAVGLGEVIIMVCDVPVAPRLPMASEVYAKFNR